MQYPNDSTPQSAYRLPAPLTGEPFAWVLQPSACLKRKDFIDEEPHFHFAGGHHETDLRRHRQRRQHQPPGGRRGGLAECRTLHGCETGQAKITGGYRLPARYVIHTPGPIWRGGDRNEPNLLASCYRSCLSLARENGCKTVCFPSISTGVYHFPLDRAAAIAIGAIAEFLKENDTPETVTMVCFDSRTKAAYEGALADLD